MRKPLGVVAVIVPWNLPLLLLTWKVAPALACGNAVVVKPSEETPATATLLAEVLDEVGLPAGVYNVVHGFGANSAGEFLTTHPGIDGVTFTGSSATGSHVMKTVAPRVRPVSFELGGKNAAIVFDDVDIDEALTGLTKSVFTNTGQVCLCTERVYVHRSDLRRHRRRTRRAGAAIASRATRRSRHHHRPAHLAGAPEEGSRLLRDRRAGGREGAHRRRDPGPRAEVSRSDRGSSPPCGPGLTNKDRVAARGDLRTGRRAHPVRHRGGGDRPGQRHRVRPGRLRVDQRPAPRTPRRAEDERRNLLGQHVVHP